MRIEYGKGKRTAHRFMPSVTVVRPEDWDISRKIGEPSRPEDIQAMAELRKKWMAYQFQKHTTSSWISTAHITGTETHLNSYENTLKGIKRWLKHKDYPKGTIIIVPNWYFGYATLIITK